MARTLLNAQLRWRLLSHLRNARSLSDDLFRLVEPDALYDRPIRERHRLVFYLGHLEAFDWNMICASLFEMKSIMPEFDKLFAFGIDPTSGNLPDDQPRDWPRESQIRQYNSKVRQA